LHLTVLEINVINFRTCVW